MPTADLYLNELRKCLGITEDPSGSNKTPIGVAFGWNGVPWCAETVSVCTKRAGLDFWSASTIQMESYARQGHNGAVWLPSSAAARPGDLCIWDWSGSGHAEHVSTVEAVRSDGTLITIGGNEQDACRRAVRSRRCLRGFIRLPFAPPPTPPPPPPPSQSVAHPTLKSGSTGPAVKEFQWKINAVANQGLVGDGSYGPASVQACKNFQAYLHLTVDGVCGPSTWSALDYAYAQKHGS